jgi:hypothetical protein
VKSEEVQNLTPGTVLDDKDPAVRDIMREVYKTSRTHIPGMFQKVRTVRSVQVNRTYAYITFESYGIVRRPKDYVVGVKS